MELPAPPPNHPTKDVPEANAAAAKTHRLTRSTVASMRLAKVFSDTGRARINALDFSPDGELLITSADDESLHLYSTAQGTAKKTVFCKKYGCSLVRFTHHEMAIVMASKNTKGDETLRYLSLHDQRYLRYFKGHRSRVVSLELSPVSDFLLSGSLDGTVRMWDLRTNACQGLLRVSGAGGPAPHPAVAFDPVGQVFAVAAGQNAIKMYDARTYDAGPFATFFVPAQAAGTTAMGGIRFSPDGQALLYSTGGPTVYLIDSFRGQLVNTFGTRSNRSGAELEACFSPDGQFILSGSEDGTIRVWEADGQPETDATNAPAAGVVPEVATFSGHAGSVGVVRWCPTKLLLASGCSQLGLWIPQTSLRPRAIRTV